MIESVFGIVHSSKSYFLTLQQFEFAVKYILDTKYGIDPSLFEMRINYIQDETVFVFNEKHRHEIFEKIINKSFSFRNESFLKSKIISCIFGSESVSEKVIYSELSNSRIKGIIFTIKENQEYLESYAQGMQIINCPHIDKINAQIRVLNEKKIDIIRNNKR